jgi:hypothetical protein
VSTRAGYQVAHQHGRRRHGEQIRVLQHRQRKQNSSIQYKYTAGARDAARNDGKEQAWVRSTKRPQLSPPTRTSLRKSSTSFRVASCTTATAQQHRVLEAPRRTLSQQEGQHMRESNEQFPGAHKLPHGRCTHHAVNGRLRVHQHLRKGTTLHRCGVHVGCRRRQRCDSLHRVPRQGSRRHGSGHTTSTTHLAHTQKPPPPCTCAGVKRARGRKGCNGPHDPRPPHIFTSVPSHLTSGPGQGAPCPLSSTRPCSSTSANASLMMCSGLRSSWHTYPMIQRCARVLRKTTAAASDRWEGAMVRRATTNAREGQGRGKR